MKKNTKKPTTTTTTLTRTTSRVSQSVSQSVSQPARSPGFVLSGGLGTPQLGTHLRDTPLDKTPFLPVFFFFFWVFANFVE
jgi:hypothetical protein